MFRTWQTDAGEKAPGTVVSDRHSSGSKLFGCHTFDAGVPVEIMYLPDGHRGERPLKRTCPPATYGLPWLRAIEPVRRPLRLKLGTGKSTAIDATKKVGMMSSMLKLTAFYLSSALLAFSVSPVAAQQLSPDWTRCANQGNAFSPDLQISGCTAVLQSGRETAGNRAIAYCNRAFAYAAKKDNDRAIADYSEAIRLNPNLASAYYNRGNAYSHKGDNDRAIADYSEAIRLNPARQRLRQPRQRDWHQGDNDRAIADTARPSGSVRTMPLPTTTGASRTGPRATAIAPSPTSARPSGSIRASPAPTTTAAMRTGTRATMTAPSPTTVRPSGSIRATPTLTTAGASRTGQGRQRPRHRRSQRGHQVQSERCHCLQRPGPRVRGQGRQ